MSVYSTVFTVPEPLFFFLSSSTENLNAQVIKENSHTALAEINPYSRRFHYKARWDRLETEPFQQLDEF